MAGGLVAIHHPAHPADDGGIQVLLCVLTGLNSSPTMQPAWLQVSLNPAASVASSDQHRPPVLQGGV